MRRQFPVKLAMQRAEDSPDVDTDPPVPACAAAFWRVMSKSHAWDPYWASGYMLGAMGTPFRRAAIPVRREARRS
jgi:hypothetical protein